MSDIEREELVKILSYCPRSGIFRWKPRPLSDFSMRSKPKRDWLWWDKNKSGKVAGWKHNDGYTIISLNNKKIFAHRAAYLMIYGTKPPMIDHVNGEPEDNRLDNLRGCKERSNQFNVKLPKTNTSGYKGVYLHKRSGLWYAEIRADKKRHHIGAFKNPIDAALAYDDAAVKLHGLYAKTNKMLGLLKSAESEPVNTQPPQEQRGAK